MVLQRVKYDKDLLEPREQIEHKALIISKSKRSEKNTGPQCFSYFLPLKTTQLNNFRGIFVIL